MPSRREAVCPRCKRIVPLDDRGQLLPHRTRLHVGQTCPGGGTRPEVEGMARVDEDQVNPTEER